MDHIENVLTTLENDRKYDVAIRNAISIARRTLNRYYSLTDSSEVYRICMSTWHSQSIDKLISDVLTVLHPRHKLTYFTKAGWPAEWITVAETLARKAFEQYTAICEVEDNLDSGDEGSVVSTSNVRLDPIL